jgi:hypothetical protein
MVAHVFFSDFFELLFSKFATLVFSFLGEDR